MPRDDWDTCRHCSTEHSDAGPGCPYGENNVHVLIGDEDHCIYCKSQEYGSLCSYAPMATDGKVLIHVHGHGKTNGQSKCIWCGSTEKGHGCPYSPDGKHHF